MDLLGERVVAVIQLGALIMAFVSLFFILETWPAILLICVVILILSIGVEALMKNIRYIKRTSKGHTDAD